VSVSITRAVCPACGGFEQYTVHIRSEGHDEMVCAQCAACREGPSGRPTPGASTGGAFPAPLVPPRRSLLRRVR